VDGILVPRHVLHVRKPLTAQVAGKVPHTFAGNKNKENE
jgi:hypothetical protein